MKIKKIIILYGVLFIISCLSACHMDSPAVTSSADDNTGTSTVYVNKVLPSKLMVKIPASLSINSSDGTNLDESTEKCIKPGPEHSYTYKSGGYFKIKKMLKMMGDYVTTLEIYGILSDAVISQNSLQPGTYENLNITLTREVYDAIAAQLPECFTPPETMVGMVLTIPSLTYSNDNSGALVNSISISFNPAKTLTYAWSADLTKLKMAVDDTCRDINVAITYDSSTGSSAFKVVDSFGDNLLMAIEHDPASTANGVYASMNLEWAEGTSYNVTGYADDNGGLVIAEIVIPSNPGTDEASKTFYFREGFDGKGHLLLAETSSDGETWTTSDKYNDTALITAYGEDAATAKTMEYSAVLLL